MMAVFNQNYKINQKPLTNTNSGLNDQELIERSQRGDREAFSHLAGRYLNMMYSVALAITHNPEDAEDACQEAMIKAFRYIRTIREPEKFGGWIRNIVKQEVYGKYRKKSRFWKLLDQLTIENQSKQENIQFSGDTKLYHQQLFEYSINKLSTKAREIVLMHYMAELSCEQIAFHTNLSVGAVKSHLFKARNKMLQVLSEIGIHSLEE